MRRTGVRFTYRDYCLLPEDRRYEVVDGELAMVPAPSPRHQDVVREIGYRLETYARQHGGRVYRAPIDVILSELDIVQPDILYLAPRRLTLISTRGIEGAPDLVVEVLSPSRPERDRVLKQRLYAGYGVQEYWIVDPEARTIDLWVPANLDLRLEGTYVVGDEVGSRLLEGFSLSVGDAFPWSE